MSEKKNEEEGLLPPPRHVAMIMDGNRRWAKKRLMPAAFGYQAGLEAMRRMIRHADEFGIEILTFYAFSTENWSRPKGEVDFLMRLPLRFIEQDLPEMMKNNIKMIVSGRRAGIPEKTWHTIEQSCRETEANTGLTVNLAFNYGGRAEIVDAVRTLLTEAVSGVLSAERIATLTEADIAAKLYQPELPDPDLIVRAAGEQRLSNFLLWESAYAEFCSSDKYWPDFQREDLAEIVARYRQRERRFGG